MDFFADSDLDSDSHTLTFACLFRQGSDSGSNSNSARQSHSNWVRV